MGDIKQNSAVVVEPTKLTVSSDDFQARQDGVSEFSKAIRAGNAIEPLVNTIVRTRVGSGQSASRLENVQTKHPDLAHLAQIARTVC